MRIIQNGTLITPEGKREADLAIDKGMIVRIEERIDPDPADEVLDAKGCYVYPRLMAVPQAQIGRRDGFISLNEFCQAEERERMLYAVITGEIRGITAENEEEREVGPYLLFQMIGEALDPYGYLKLLCENAARAVGEYPMEGAVRIGSAAHLTVVDPNHKGIVPEQHCHAGRKTVGLCVAEIG